MSLHTALPDDVEDLDVDQRELDQLQLDVELDGAEPFRVVTTNADRVRWDLHRAKAKWPSATDAPFLFLTFLAHNAARRSGQYAGTFDTFATDCTLVKAVKRDDEPADVARPSQPGPALD